MVELLQAGQTLLAMKSPSTSIPSNGEEHIFHGQRRTNSSQALSFSPCSALSTLWDCPWRRFPRWGEEEVGKLRLLLPSQHVICLEKDQTPGFTQVEYSAWGLYLLLLFFFSRESQKFVSEWQFGLLGFSGFYFSPLGNSCQLLLHAYETHSFQPFLTGVK